MLIKFIIIKLLSNLFRAGWGNGCLVLPILPPPPPPLGIHGHTPGYHAVECPGIRKGGGTKI